MTAIAFDHTYARLPEAFFARVSPATVPEPGLIGLNRPLATVLGMDPEWLMSAAGIAMLAGNALPENADPIAMVYAGHQFGGWSPQLGDGRAVLIGEVVGTDGVRRDLQLKGAGRTPFSRGGDGKSPVGPVIREFLVSEAMAALGIPTTRALAAVTTGELVQRDAPLPGAVLARVAQSHVRVGTFQFFQGRGEDHRVKELADYVIDRHYPESREAANPYRSLLEGVIRRQADLIAHWMHVGFIHGVMNTDNMQIAGETIDFGPCAFMEHFDPGTVLSSIDRNGRYAWANQPGIGQWNLTRLAESLIPLLAEGEEQAVEIAKDVLGLYGETFNAAFLDGMGRKFGLGIGVFESSEAKLEYVNESFAAMAEQRVDFTLFFRHLTRVAAGGSDDALIALFKNEPAAKAWLSKWQTVRATSATAPDETVNAMRGINPIFIPRNHRVEEAIQAGLRGDFSKFETLRVVLEKPFEEQPERAEYERPAGPGETVEQTFCGT